MSDLHTIYGSNLEDMQQAMTEVIDRLHEIRLSIASNGKGDPVDHLMFRIKSDASMRDKCRRNGLPENENSALHVLKDAIGIRLVCSFISDVYLIRDEILRLPDCEIITEKDYIRCAKPNGYRSDHIVLRYKNRFFMEIQLRTISMDNWAALEHQMRYKKSISGNTELIAEELKRCADELASTDVSMQTIRDMIYNEGARQK